MYKRIITELIPQRASCFLLGPRQCGKTTVLRGLESLLYLDLLETEQFLQYNRRPSLLYKEVSALKKRSGTIIIDEIQKVPLLLDEVQRCIDQYPNLHFILSGSSARKLKRGAANLLGGRAIQLSLFPLSVEELGKDFDLDLALSFGSLPKISSLLAQGEKNLVQDILRSYVSVYLSEEIKAEALVRNLESFQRFLEVAACQFAREVNQSALADQAQIAANSVKNYYSILEDTLIGFYLSPWATSVRKQLAKTPKFYFFDNGVVRALQGSVASEASNQETGYLFEQFMINEVRKLNSYLRKDLKLNFWKTDKNAEVDLVLSRGNTIILAVEFKATPYPHTRDLRGLKSFREEHPKVKSLLCAPVARQHMLNDDIAAVRPEDLLEEVKKL